MAAETENKAGIKSKEDTILDALTIKWYLRSQKCRKSSSSEFGCCILNMTNNPCKTLSACFCGPLTMCAPSMVPLMWPPHLYLLLCPLHFTHWLKREEYIHSKHWYSVVFCQHLKCTQWPALLSLMLFYLKPISMKALRLPHTWTVLTSPYAAWWKRSPQCFFIFLHRFPSPSHIITCALLRCCITYDTCTWEGVKKWALV